MFELIDLQAENLRLPFKIKEINTYVHAFLINTELGATVFQMGRNSAMPVKA